MGPAELLKAAAKRVSADTEKLTRRNMKESVAEFIQTKCIDDLGFARITRHRRMFFFKQKTAYEIGQ